MLPRRLTKHIEIRDEPAVAPRPQQLDAARREIVGAEPVEEQMGCVRRARESGRPPSGVPAEPRRAKACDLPCHDGGDNKRDACGRHAVSGRPMRARHKEIGIRQHRQRGADGKGFRRRSASVDRVGGVDDRDAGERVAYRTRHAALGRSRGQFRPRRWRRCGQIARVRRPRGESDVFRKRLICSNLSRRLHGIALDFRPARF